MIGEGGDLVDARCPAPARLGKRQIHADGHDSHIVSQIGRLRVKPAGFHIAHRCIQRRNTGNNKDFPFESGKLHRLQIIAKQFDIGRLIARGKFGPAQREDDLEIRDMDLMIGKSSVPGQFISGRCPVPLDAICGFRRAPCFYPMPRITCYMP